MTPVKFLNFRGVPRFVKVIIANSENLTSDLSHILQ
ncbi:hypothetical protein VPHK460_0156 [Vibrio phage K460]